MNEQNGTLTHALVTGCPSTMGDDVPLNTTTLIRHAARTYGDQEILYRNAAGGWDRYTYRDCYERVGRAANALRSLGVGPGDRVGVLDWNISTIVWEKPAARSHWAPGMNRQRLTLIVSG